MNEADALALLRASGDFADGEKWADLGAGRGTFTRALATLVAPDGRVHAVDRDAGALDAIRRWAAGRRPRASISLVHADVTGALVLPPLDGVVMANVLHFIREQSSVLERVAGLLKPGGRLVLIEYEGRRPSRWVPHPLSPARFAELAAEAGLIAPRVVATRPSAFGGELYVAVARNPA
jgi:ubiquinone/menaquinone biosynthesis C-methylase UbiE